MLYSTSEALYENAEGEANIERLDSYVGRKCDCIYNYGSVLKCLYFDNIWRPDFI